MNQQKIRELAGRSGGHFYFESLASRPAQKREGVSFTFEQLEAFAKLVASAAIEKVEEYSAEEYMTDIHRAIKIEREACLAIAEKQRYAMNISLTSLPAQNGTAVDIANAIRARGEPTLRGEA